MPLELNRRSLGFVGVGAFGVLPVARALAQGETAPPPPTPDNLAAELPSLRPAPAQCSDLPKLPPPASPDAIARLFPGFASWDVQASGATIHGVSHGSGPPLLLLHGHPETHATWHKVAPTLAEHFTVYAPDLRGYGDSSKPGYTPDHEAYSFRAMAQDMVEVMAHFGHRTFMVAGHDRGGRVVHRMMLDHQAAVLKGAVLDVAPTLTMYDDTNKAFATAYVWWFLQIQPAPMPEHLISNDPGYYLRDHLAVQGKTPGAVTPEAMAEYMRCYCCEGTIRAVCEDYRAAASIDLDLDRQSDAQGTKIQAPLLALWGAKGTVGHLWDVLETWKPKTRASLEGQSLPCGHLIPEEQPQLVIEHFQRFFSA